MKPFLVVMIGTLVATQAHAGRYEQRCEIVTVPYEAQAAGSVEGAVVGGVVGGVLGRAVTGDSKGTTAGALIGGVIGSQKGNRTVTRYREEQRCSTVFIPERIEDPLMLSTIVDRLNARQSVTPEQTKDVQFTVGTTPDGVWGPNSRRMADQYLATLR